MLAAPRGLGLALRSPCPVPQLLPQLPGPAAAASSPLEQPRTRGPASAATAVGLTAAVLLSQRSRGRGRGRVLFVALKAEAEDKEEAPKKKVYKSEDEIVSRDGSQSQLDFILPDENALVNVDVPNHFLEVYRQKRRKDGLSRLRGIKGRSASSKKKVEWRLKEGPPLAHKNWDYPSRVRITTGIARNRRLEQPEIEVAPMMSRVREALFSHLKAMQLFEDRSVRVLDLFAGTGSCGIEALSRGATECLFVDSKEECVNCCIANAWLAGFMEKEEAAKGPINERKFKEKEPMMMVGGARSRLQLALHRTAVSNQPVGGILGDAVDFLENPQEYGVVNRKFNLIMCTPDFNTVSYRQLCTALAKTELLERDGIVAIEYPKELGVLPPILTAPFEDPDDADDIAAGVPMLFGMRNRKHCGSMLALYIKAPTGVRGRGGEPRAWEFTESTIAKKLRVKSRSLWRTASLFSDIGDRGFADPKKVKRLKW